MYNFKEALIRGTLIKKTLTAAAISLGVLATLLTTPASVAHMMVAQGGTLNFVGKDVFMVLSLPTSAFELQDTDGNGAISMAEFRGQRDMVIDKVHGRVQLRDQTGPLVLQGLMLSPEIDHDSETENVSQVVILGKFNYSESSEQLRFTTDLFGGNPDEQEFNMSARRKPQKIEQLFQLVPDNPAQELLTELLHDSANALEI